MGLYFPRELAAVVLAGTLIAGSGQASTPPPTAATPVQKLMPVSHRTELTVSKVTEAVSLVPSSLLVGTVKPDEKFRAKINLWSRNASIIPKFLTATSTKRKQITASITNGGRSVTLTFIPGKVRGAISGDLIFKVQYGPKVIRLHEDYFAYVLRRHGEPIPKQVVK